MKKQFPTPIAVALLIFAMLACNLPAAAPANNQPLSPGTPNPPGMTSEVATPNITESTATPTINIIHTLTPAGDQSLGKPIYDVDSSGTAPEKRAPYGDSYDINRLERPFLKDMTYIPDLDIGTFSLSYDANFYYVSIDLIGNDPNNPMGIQYGVELDVNADGFGDFIVLGKPPFSKDWSTANVQVFADNNRDTSGLSADKSDAPITTDGYETLIYDGSAGTNNDPDLAWVRINFSDDANVQFSFKKSLAGSSFMYGVIADGGLKDVGKLDYVDRFKEAEAGSPVKDKKYYPLGALFAVDNTCREVLGFKPTGYEPMLCPRDQPNPTRKTTAPTSVPPTPPPPPIP